MKTLKDRLPEPFQAAAFGLPLLAYLFTLGPSVFWLDAGIYLAASKELGIAYPPGFPLCVILGHLFGQAPLGTFAQRVHLLSALCASLASLLVYRTCLDLGRDGEAPARSRRALASAVAVGFGLSFALWSQAINAEAYALQILITATLLWLVSRILEAPSPPPGRRWLLAALVFGAGFANHPMIVGMIPPMLYVAWTRRRDARAWARTLPAFLLAGLLPYAYMPLRSLADPLTDWGDPETPLRFLRLVTASHWTAESASFSFFGPGFLERTADAARLFFLQFWPAALLLGLLGAFVMRKKTPRFLAVLAMTGAFALLLPLFYTQTKEFESWFLPAYLAFAPCVGAGAVAFLEYLQRILPARKTLLASLLPALLWLAFPLPLLVTALPAVDRTGDHHAEDYARNILNGVGRDGILLLSGDNPSSTVLFAQAVLGVRRDVAMVNQEALVASWYRGYVRENLGLALPPSENVERATGHEVTDLVLSIIGKNPRRPVYSLMPSHLALPPPFQPRSSGMVYRIDGRGPPPPFDAWAFTFHDPEGPFRTFPDDQREKIDQAWREMRAGYLRAYKEGGDLFLGRREFGRAAKLYENAVRLAPAREAFRLRLGVCRVQEGKTREAREVFETLVENDPASFLGWYNLGNVLDELGHRPDARRAWRRALEINPRFTLARDALAEK